MQNTIERGRPTKIFLHGKKLLRDRNRSSTNSCELMARGITSRGRNKGAIIDCCLSSYFLQCGETKSFSCLLLVSILIILWNRHISLSLSLYMLSNIQKRKEFFTIMSFSCEYIARKLSCACRFVNTEFEILNYS